MHSSLSIVESLVFRTGLINYKLPFLLPACLVLFMTLFDLIPQARLLMFSSIILKNTFYMTQSLPTTKLKDFGVLTDGSIKTCIYLKALLSLNKINLSLSSDWSFARLAICIRLYSGSREFSESNSIEYIIQFFH